MVSRRGFLLIFLVLGTSGIFFGGVGFLGGAILGFSRVWGFGFFDLFISNVWIYYRSSD